MYMFLFPCTLLKLMLSCSIDRFVCLFYNTVSAMLLFHCIVRLLNLELSFPLLVHMHFSLHFSKGTRKEQSNQDLLLRYHLSSSLVMLIWPEKRLIDGRVTQFLKKATYISTILWHFSNGIGLNKKQSKTIYGQPSHKNMDP